MRISLSDLGKRFNRDWIFRHRSFEFLSGKSYAITGPNGSGKSTLLQVIAGAIAPSEGSIQYDRNGKSIEPDHAYRHLAIAAPYLELLEEMTFREFLDFHRSFKPLLPSVHPKDIFHLVNLENAADKQIRYYSSGMKQRAKLAQAFFSDVDCLLLDEPCTNLDEQGIRMYQSLVRDFGGGRLIIVSSNDLQEYGFCESVIRMDDGRNTVPNAGLQ